MKSINVCGLVLGDLIELSAIKLPPSENWILSSPQHHVEEKFTTGLLGKNGFQLLEVIAKIYGRLEGERETIPWEDEDGTKGEAPFWGDHGFLEIIDLDEDKKIMTLHFGS